MPLSLYEISVPPFIRGINSMLSILEKGEAHAGENTKVITESRLIADMQDFCYQIQRVSDTAKGLAVRIGRAEPVSIPDTEKTIPELKERLRKTLAILEALSPTSMDDMEDQEVELKTAKGVMKFTGKSYVTTFAVPNFYFHYCMMYALLRKEGVEIGKRDFLGA